MRRICSSVLIGVALGCFVPIVGCGDDDGEGEGVGGASASVQSGAGGSAAANGNGAGGSAAGSSAVGSGEAGDGGSGPSNAGGAPACESISQQVLAEELPDPDASLAGVAFNGNIPSFVDAVLQRRYPFGLELVQGGRRETSFGDCSLIFADGAESAADIYSSIEVIVHECGHVQDSFLSSSSGDVYAVQSDLTFQCARGDTTTRGGDTFARSRIAGDDYQSLRPPCASSSRPGCDPYADVYLNGDPDDAVFESGDQGFNLLMEEAVQYVHSVATAWAFLDQQSPNIAVSARDGILTFLWYIERYLHMARTEFPDAYERISGDDCWRDLTLSVWTRAQRYLALTRNEGRLGIEDDDLAQLVAEPELLDEINRLRELDDCP